MMEMMGKSALYDVIHARKVICINVHDYLSLNCHAVTA